VVTSIHVFEHLPDCYPIVAEFRRILRPGGIALVMVPSYDAFRSRLRARRYWNTPYQHMNGFTGRALDTLFGSHGFRKRRLCAKWLGPVPGVGWRGRASTLLAKHAGNLFGFYPTKLLGVYESE
jgi:SAM-dependent methyltransferase